jgi:cation transport ATPase
LGRRDKSWWRKLTLLGLQGMIDPARPKVKMAVSVAKVAGLRSIMITGDYDDTAQVCWQRNHVRWKSGKSARIDLVGEREKSQE